MQDKITDGSSTLQPQWEDALQDSDRSNSRHFWISGLWVVWWSLVLWPRGGLPKWLKKARH